MPARVQFIVFVIPREEKDKRPTTVGERSSVNKRTGFTKMRAGYKSPPLIFVYIKTYFLCSRKKYEAANPKEKLRC